VFGDVAVDQGEQEPTASTVEAHLGVGYGFMGEGDRLINIRLHKSPISTFQRFPLFKFLLVFFHFFISKTEWSQPLGVLNSP